MRILRGQSTSPLTPPAACAVSHPIHITPNSPCLHLLSFPSRITSHLARISLSHSINSSGNTYEQHYTWRGFRQSRGIRSKTKRVLTQFSPHDFTAFQWHGTQSFVHYVTVVILLAVFLAAELNPFYLKVRTFTALPLDRYTMSDDPDAL